MSSDAWWINAIRAGATRGELLRSLLGEKMLQTLQLCAAVRWFDGELFEFLSAGQPPDERPSLQAVMQLPLVEAVPGSPGVYRVRRRDREELLERQPPDDRARRR